MANVKHSNLVGNRNLLVSLLIKQKMPLHAAAEFLGCGYGSILNQMRQHLTQNEIKEVEANRARRTFSASQRLKLLSECQVFGTAETSKNRGIHPVQLARWRKQHSKQS